MSAIVFQAAAGLGKTAEVVRRIAYSDKALIEVYVPTHALAYEFKQRIESLNPVKSVAIILGRSATGTDGEPVCRKALLAEATSRAGFSVFPNLCFKARKDKPAIKCEHYDDCPYIAQYRHADVRIYTHAYLPLERSLLESRIPDAVIIDESFVSSCIGTKTVKLATLADPTIPDAAKALSADIASNLLTNSQAVLDRMRVAVESGEYAKAIRALKKSLTIVSPAMSEEEVTQRLAKAFPYADVVVLLQALLVDSAFNRPMQSVTIDPKSGHPVVHYKKPITRFKARGLRSALSKQPRIVILDASASKQIIEQFFEITHFEKLSVRRNARVVQCISTRCSTTSLVPDKNTSPESRQRAERKLQELQSLIETHAATGKKVLVIGPSAVVGNPRTKIEPLLKCPEGTEFGHFQAIRGIDRWKDFDVIIVIGRNQPATKDVENIARAIFANDPLPLTLTRNWIEVARPHQHGDGTVGVKVQVHPDERIQAVTEQTRERESEQAIDRLRLIHNEFPKKVILTSSLPLDVEVHELRSWDEIMMGGTHLEQAWHKLGAGVLPLNPTWLAEKFDPLWKSAGAVRKDVERTLKNGQNPNRNLIRRLSVLTFEYRLPGQKRWSKCLSSFATIEETTQALANLLAVQIHVRSPEDRP